MNKRYWLDVATSMKYFLGIVAILSAVGFIVDGERGMICGAVMIIVPPFNILAILVIMALRPDIGWPHGPSKASGGRTKHRGHGGAQNAAAKPKSVWWLDKDL